MRKSARSEVASPGLPLGNRHRRRVAALIWPRERRARYGVRGEELALLPVIRKFVTAVRCSFLLLPERFEEDSGPTQPR